MCFPAIAMIIGGHYSVDRDNSVTIKNDMMNHLSSSYHRGLDIAILEHPNIIRITSGDNRG